MTIRAPVLTSFSRRVVSVLQDQGIRVTATLGEGCAVIQAVDDSGEIHQVRRDDTDLLAAVVEIAQMMGWAFE